MEAKAVTFALAAMLAACAWAKRDAAGAAAFAAVPVTACAVERTVPFALAAPEIAAQEKAAMLAVEAGDIEAAAEAMAAIVESGRFDALERIAAAVIESGRFDALERIAAVAISKWDAAIGMFEPVSHPWALAIRAAIMEKNGEDTTEIWAELMREANKR